MNWWKTLILIIVTLLIGFFLGYFFKECPSEPVEPVVLHDTLKITDTLRITEHTKPCYVTRWDTIWVPVPSNASKSDDSTCNSHVTDSIAVEIPITQYQYRDTFVTDTSNIELGIAFSGYDAKIDSIDLQYRFEVAPRVVEKKNGWGQFFGVGVGAGYGINVVSGKVVAGPEVSVHLTYGWGYHW